MLVGEYIIKVGDKNRVAVPKKFREILGNHVVVTKGFDECLLVMSTAQWEEIVRGEITGSFVSRVTRDISRFFLASSEEVELDEQGRFVLPDFLKKYAKIKSNISILGLYNKVEIWDSRIWDQKKQKLEKSVITISRKLR